MSAADDFVITRRRKKYKFARFDEFSNCYHLDEWIAGAPPMPGKKLIVEIGAGSALFLVELARRYPDNFYIAIDIKGDRLYRGARAALEQGIANIVFVRSEIQHLGEIVPAHSVDEIWLTFSDPYPRKSDARHRLSAPRYLELYRQVLHRGVLHFKTDNQPLFDWSVEQFGASGWKIGAMTRDLHGSDLPDEYKIMTSYEQKFTEQGLPIFYLDATPKLNK
ncbi:MAG: tRNA (guanosine(46)-N7)-methyltransferase TrmB [Candidatus Nomurabacteria bacterium]|jgi:tRNA (guanine-N7-)-methyltransferase|nr:tRNA (guanosine(46)-N7)-methyltransferase TrmB [Candidatus Nomurabacteria bacterium]